MAESLTRYKLRMVQMNYSAEKIIVSIDRKPKDDVV